MGYRTARTLCLADAAYLAGLVDGEGTITLSRRHSNESRQLVLSISSTEPALLNWVLRATGVGKITRKRTVCEHHAPGLTYAVSNRQAMLILSQIAPHLQSYKKLRARLALDRYLAVTPRNGKYSAALAAERARFERDFLSITADAGR